MSVCWENITCDKMSPSFGAEDAWWQGLEDRLQWFQLETLNNGVRPSICQAAQEPLAWGMSGFSFKPGPNVRIWSLQSKTSFVLQKGSWGRLRYLSMCGSSRCSGWQWHRTRMDHALAWAPWHLSIASLTAHQRSELGMRTKLICSHKDYIQLQKSVFWCLFVFFFLKCRLSFFVRVRDSNDIERESLQIYQGFPLTFSLPLSPEQSFSRQRVRNEMLPAQLHESHPARDPHGIPMRNVIA